VIKRQRGVTIGRANKSNGKGIRDKGGKERNEVDKERKKEDEGLRYEKIIPR
jgi:hypothetical protein